MSLAYTIRTMAESQCMDFDYSEREKVTNVCPSCNHNSVMLSGYQGSKIARLKVDVDRGASNNNKAVEGIVVAADGLLSAAIYAKTNSLEG